MAARTAAARVHLVKIIHLFVPGVARSRWGGATALTSAAASGVDRRVFNNTQIGVRGNLFNLPWRNECV